MQTTQTSQTNTIPSFWYCLDMQNHTQGFGYSCPDICRLSSCFEHPDFRMMGKMLPWNQMKKKMTKRTAGDKDTQIDKDLVFHSVSSCFISFECFMIWGRLGNFKSPHMSTLMQRPWCWKLHDEFHALHLTWRDWPGGFLISHLERSFPPQKSKKGKRAVRRPGGSLWMPGVGSNDAWNHMPFVPWDHSSVYPASCSQHLHHSVSM